MRRQGSTPQPAITEDRVQADFTRIYISQDGLTECTLEVSKKKGDKDSSKISCLRLGNNAINDTGTTAEAGDLLES